MKFAASMLQRLGILWVVIVLGRTGRAVINHLNTSVGVTKAMEHLPGMKQRKEWLLSQSYFGWPSNRARLYTILVLKSAGKLCPPGLNVMDQLYRVPNMSAHRHLCAPQVA